MTVLPRDYPCRDGYYYSGGGCYPKSDWYFWGRWVLAGVIALFVLIVLVVLGCISSRRRRRRGLQPFYGTGWMANGKHNNNPNQQWGGYQQGVYQQQPYGAPPAYGQPPVQNQYTGTTFNPNDGYYGGHNEGIQLQQPQHSYQREQVYSPPAGPPPGK